MAVYYHVAGPNYRPGDPLLCYNRLTDLGIDPGEWKWDAEEGYDGDVVCLYETLDKAREHRGEYGGSCILQVTIPEDEDLGVYECPFGGYIQPSLTRVDEGYVAVRDGIPAEWIEVVE